MPNTNRLINESSPYLLQHAYNPVDWYPWGGEAIALAARESKPVLVSIGYSACHWCHVMERESFENEAVAAFMNANFVNIKIDREERPDLDHIYMDAVQAISGSGGWPLNVFLTSSLKPFFGGTYYPPQRAFNRPSWMEVLKLIVDAWENRRDEVEEQAKTLVEHIGKTDNFLQKQLQPEDILFSEETVRGISRQLLKNADKEYGGFGAAPKFPQTFSLQYLLMYGYLFKDAGSREHAIFSLKQMIRGGIYDHLAGGLCRYSTDNKWLVPHFEKMLYDNALLISVLSEAFQVTGDKEFSDAIHSIFTFLQTEMKSAEGGFYAALDADSEGVEGKFYTWEKSEIERIIGDESELCCAWFGVSQKGNWESTNILNLRKGITEFAGECNLDVNQLENSIGLWTEKLLRQRNKRVRPGTDDKVLTGWNALLITAFCKSYGATGNDLYKEEAISLFDFLITELVKDERLYHTYKKGEIKIPAFLDDHAFLIEAAINLQEITGNERYLYQARDLSEFVMDNFSAEGGLFYYTPSFQDDVVIRKIELFDNALPSGNSVMARNLIYLSVVFDKPSWKEKAGSALMSISEMVKKFPSSFGIWSRILLEQQAGMPEIVLTGEKIDEMLKEILRIYIPNRILQSSNAESKLPLLKEKHFEEQPLIYLCKNYSCHHPVKTTDALLNLIIQ